MRHMYISQFLKLPNINNLHISKILNSPLTCECTVDLICIVMASNYQIFSDIFLQCNMSFWTKNSLVFWRVSKFLSNKVRTYSKPINCSEVIPSSVTLKNIFIYSNFLVPACFYFLWRSHQRVCLTFLSSFLVLSFMIAMDWLEISD